MRLWNNVGNCPRQQIIAATNLDYKVNTAPKLLAEIKASLDAGLGMRLVTASLIKEKLGTTAAIVSEIQHNNTTQFKLFMVRGDSDISCVIKTNLQGRQPELLDANSAQLILASYRLNGGGCSSSSTMKKHLNWSNEQLLQAINNPKADLFLLSKLADTNQAATKVWLAIIHHPKANSSVLGRIARNYIAKNENTDKELLLAISNHPKADEFVLYCVVQDNNTDNDVLWALMKQPKSNGVWEQIAQHKQTDKKILLTIIKQPKLDYFSLKNVAKNNLADKEILQAIMQHQLASHVLSYIAANNNADKDIFMAVMNHPQVDVLALKNIAQNNNADREILLAITHHPLANDILLSTIPESENVNKKILLAILQHPRANSIIVLNSVARNKHVDSEILLTITQHPAATHDLLLRLVKHALVDARILKAALGHNNGGIKLLLGLNLADLEFADDNFPKLKFETETKYFANHLDEFWDKYFNHFNNEASSILTAIDSINNQYVKLKTQLMAQVLEFLQHHELAATLTNPLCDILLNSAFDYSSLLAHYPHFTNKLLNSVISQGNNHAWVPTARELNFYLNYINQLSSPVKAAFFQRNNGFFIQCLYHGSVTETTKQIASKLNNEYLAFNSAAAEVAEAVYGPGEPYFLLTTQANQQQQWLAVSPQYMASFLYGAGKPQQLTWDTLAYITPTSSGKLDSLPQAQLNLTVIFQRFPIFLDNFQFAQHNAKFYNLLTLLKLGNLSYHFMQATKVKSYPIKFTQPQQQQLLADLFKPHFALKLAHDQATQQNTYIIQDDPYMINEQHWQNLITACNLTHASPTQQAHVLLILSVIFTKYSSSSIFGTEQESPLILRYYALALMEKAVQLDKNMLSKNSYLDFKNKFLGTNQTVTCSDLLSSAILQQCKQFVELADYIPPAWE